MTFHLEEFSKYDVVSPFYSRSSSFMGALPVGDSTTVSWPCLPAVNYWHVLPMVTSGKGSISAGHWPWKWKIVMTMVKHSIVKIVTSVEYYLLARKIWNPDTSGPLIGGKFRRSKWYYFYFDLESSWTEVTVWEPYQGTYKAHTCHSLASFPGMGRVMEGPQSLLTAPNCPTSS